MAENVSLERYRNLRNLPLIIRQVLCGANRNLLEDTREAGLIAKEDDRVAVGNPFGFYVQRYYRMVPGTIMNDQILAKLSILGLAPLHLYEQLNLNRDPVLHDCLGGYLTISSAYSTEDNFEKSNDVRSLLKYSVACHEGIAMFQVSAKRLYKANRVGWCNNSIGAIASVTSKDYVPDGLKYPPLIGFQALNTAISAKHEFRKAICKVLRGQAMKDSGLCRNDIAVNVNQLHYCEMNHLGIIFKHLFKDNPDILCMTEFVAHEYSAMDKALAFLAS
ncbi:hypothetical protein QAD02_019827 [Eretmocerus hayati]|uniref:Uncharacterized protein n=1 Tax=Eretmocerus hayati TaxID=131215 RepID=A0ACC2PKT6_9HYME|nr:hypothetical protein QAD02_019827 [Eretmocerus hayati]